MIGAQIGYPQNFKSKAFSKAVIWTLKICISWNLRQNSDIYGYIGRHIYYQKPKNSVVWEGRPNFSFLFKSCEILEVRGDLSINVEDRKSLRVDRKACKNYALALVLCASNNSKSI